MKYTQENKEKVLNFIKENPDKINSKDIANYLGVSVNEIKGMLRWFNISLVEERKKRVAELRDLGFSNSKIAEILGYSNKEYVSVVARLAGAKKYRRRRKYVSKSNLKTMLRKCNFIVSCVEKKYGIKTDRIKKLAYKYGIIDWMIENGYRQIDKSGEKKELVLRFLRVNKSLKPKDIYQKITKIYGKDYISYDYLKKIRQKFIKGELK